MSPVWRCTRAFQTVCISCLLPVSPPGGGLQVAVNRPPFGGKLLVSASDDADYDCGLAPLVELKSKLSLTATSWVDDPSDLPLRYEFLKYAWADTLAERDINQLRANVLQPESRRKTFETQLPRGKWVMLLKVFDSWGAYSFAKGVRAPATPKSTPQHPCESEERRLKLNGDASHALEAAACPSDELQGELGAAFDGLGSSLEVGDTSKLFGDVTSMIGTANSAADATRRRLAELATEEAAEADVQEHSRGEEGAFSIPRRLAEQRRRLEMRRLEAAVAEDASLREDTLVLMTEAQSSGAPRDESGLAGRLVAVDGTVSGELTGSAMDGSASLVDDLAGTANAVGVGTSSANLMMSSVSNVMGSANAPGSCSRRHRLEELIDKHLDEDRSARRRRRLPIANRACGFEQLFTTISSVRGSALWTH